MYFSCPKVLHNLIFEYTYYMLKVKELRPNNSINLKQFTHIVWLMYVRNSYNIIYVVYYTNIIQSLTLF